MTDIDLTAVCAALEGGGLRSASIIDAGSPQLSDVNAAWTPIARSGDPEERRLLALALWNREFLDLLPRYGQILRTALLDVRVGMLSDEGAVLLYLFAGTDPAGSMMIGWDPAGFGTAEPPLWESVPAPARTFLRGTHAGYNRSSDWESCGLLRPRDMTTMARNWEEPDGIGGWFENWWPDCDPIDSRRMLYVSCTKPTYMLCTSPDVPAGQGLIYYDNEINVVDFFTSLDDNLITGAEWSGVA